MPVPRYSANELRAALERSDLPSLITEGRDDYALMRHVAVRVGGDCLPAGNKIGVLNVCRDPVIGNRARTAFLVDSDLWVFDGIPTADERLMRLVRTDGYSIENDLLRDANAEALLDDHELTAFVQDLDSVCRWFSAGVTARRSGQPFNFEVGINSILAPGTSNLTASASLAVAQYSPPQGLIDTVRNDHSRLLRGKTWLALLNRHLCAHGRLVHHQPLSLLAIGMRSGGPHSSRLANELSDLLRP